MSSTSGDPKFLLETAGIDIEASPYDKKYFINLESLDDIFYLSELLGCDLIIGTDRNGVLGLKENTPFIEIYNAYRE